MDKEKLEIELNKRDIKMSFSGDNINSCLILTFRDITKMYINEIPNLAKCLSDIDNRILERIEDSYNNYLNIKYTHDLFLEKKNE